MKTVNYSLLGLSSAVVLAIGAYAPLPGQAAQVFNVKSFGAVGNGVKDDTNSLLQAAKAAASVPGSTLLFPEGNYVFDGNVLNANSIEVLGENATLTTVSGGLRLGGNNVSVRGMNFVTLTTGATGIFVANANGFVIRGCSFNSGFTTAIGVIQSFNGTIAANRMIMSSKSSSGVNLGQNSGSITVQNNAIMGSGGNTATGLLSSTCTNVTYSSNDVQDMYVGASSLQDGGFTYSGNNFTSCPNQAISLDTDSGKTNISGNNISSTGGTAVQASNVSSLTIQNNVVKNSHIGINIQGSVGNSNTATITGNTISTVDKNAITGSNLSTFVVNRNTISHVASALNAGNVGGFLTVFDNQIASCLNAGIIATTCNGITHIQDNTMRDCGILPSSPAAVIYFNSPKTADVLIETNVYTSSRTTQLNYFIWCVQPQPPAQISNNRTNTGLPNRIGS